MAINTAEKRRSVAHIGRSYSGAGVTPNASQDVEWRQQVGRSYSGIAPVRLQAAIKVELNRRTFVFELKERTTTVELNRRTTTLELKKR